MIVLHAALPIRPDKHDEALDAAETIVEHSNEEEGVIDYRATIDLQDRNLLRFIEQYEDEAALEAHLSSDHYKQFEKQLGDLLAGEPDVVQFEVSNRTEPDL
jgi:quinol monooxygenase YgiN